MKARTITIFREGFDNDLRVGDTYTKDGTEYLVSSVEPMTDCQCGPVEIELVLMKQ
jgi:hypothetical protein